jgi:hypothetical protein
MKFSIYTLTTAALVAGSFSVACATPTDVEGASNDSDESALSGAGSKVVAKIETSSGWVRFYDAIEVRANGDINSVRGADPKTQKTALIGHLEPKAVKALLADVADLADGELVPQDPSAPQCFDAPSTTISAMNAKKVMVKLGGTSGCRTEMRKDGFATRAVTILPALSLLAE